jgi:hypothetical protein
MPLAGFSGRAARSCQWSLGSMARMCPGRRTSACESLQQKRIGCTWQRMKSSSAPGPPLSTPFAPRWATSPSNPQPGLTRRSWCCWHLPRGGTAHLWAFIWSRPVVRNEYCEHKAITRLSHAVNSRLVQRLRLRLAHGVVLVRMALVLLTAHGIVRKVQQARQSDQHPK